MRGNRGRKAHQDVPGLFRLGDKGDHRPFDAEQVDQVVLRRIERAVQGDIVPNQRPRLGELRNAARRVFAQPHPQAGRGRMIAQALRNVGRVEGLDVALDGCPMRVPRELVAAVDAGVPVPKVDDRSLRVIAVDPLHLTLVQGRGPDRRKENPVEAEPRGDLAEGAGRRAVVIVPEVDGIQLRDLPEHEPPGGLAHEGDAVRLLPAHRGGHAGAGTQHGAPGPPRSSSVSCQQYRCMRGRWKGPFHRLPFRWVEIRPSRWA